MQNLKALLKCLLESEIDFVLIGGFAGVVHGSPIVTQDIDICAALTEDNIVKLRTALKEIHPVHRMNPNFKPSFNDEPKDLKGIKNIYLKTDLGTLDIVSEVPPAGNFEDIKRNAIDISLYGHTCKVISLDDLIKIKESMSRPKDKETLRYLLKLRAQQK